MGVTSSSKIIDQQEIPCGGQLGVQLGLSAAPNIVENPVDIVLVLDRSGSMAGIPLASMKLGAETFIDIIAQSTGGGADIGSGSRIAITSFSGSATAGPLPAPVAAAAKQAGAIIYCIGLIGADGIDVDALNEWATQPPAAHVSVTPDAADLEQLFAELAANISKPGATGIVVEEEVAEDFEIISLFPPNRGTAMVLDSRRIRWEIPQLGVSGSEGAQLSFQVRHLGLQDGLLPVNQSITYSDVEGNLVSFPEPAVQVSCDVVITEPCPMPVPVVMEGCRQTMEVDVGHLPLTHAGRILQMEVTLPGICPGVRTALAICLEELDEAGQSHPRGFKAMTIPAHHAPGCRDVRVRCIRFILPEDDVPKSKELCAERLLQVRMEAHQIDSCCACPFVDTKEDP